MDLKLRDVGKIQIINKKTGKTLYESDHAEISGSVDHINKVTKLEIKAVPPITHRDPLNIEYYETNQNK